MKKLILYFILLVIPVSIAFAATGDLVGSVNFDTPCLSGIGVGIAYDGTNLWYSCGFQGGTNLYRANPVSGVVSASYAIPTEGGEGLGALAYDAGRNAIWAGWSGSTGEVILIHLDGSKSVVSSATAFHAPEAIHFDLDDGLAYDASDDTLYISGDVASTIHHYSSSGTHLGSFAPHPDGGCGNSGLALGGSLLYEGFNGCNKVVVVDKSTPATKSFDFSTVQGNDPGFRDEDLECDTNTFSGSGKHVMWSVEAYDINHGPSFGDRRALAFEIPLNTCGVGGEKAEPICGDGVVNQQSEQCDDGNNQDGDGCSADCLIEEVPIPVCGNNVVELPEQCDDGNLEDNDGCSANCTLEEPQNEVPEFTTIGAGIAIVGAAWYAIFRRKRR